MRYKPSKHKTMKQKLQIFALLCGLAISTNCFSQRYLSEIFTAVTVSSGVTYGNNISVLTGTPASQPLVMDVYQPTGDVQTTRPLIIILHAGSFLPAVASTQAIGKRTDSAVVNMCMRFARRGYVAVSADYRLGWNALSTNQDIRTGTILNAVYRAAQDAKTCVRFFRDDAANANTYKIDPTKIALGGFSGGGYAVLAAVSLNKASELQITKLIDFTQNPPAPYVNQAVAGNFDGTDTTPLNTPNYASYSSSVSVVFNIGGAIGDTSWMEAGEPPIIGMHCYKDPNAPYKTGNVIVTATGQFVIEASGSYDIVKKAQRLGNNAIINNATYSDVYTTKANVNNAGIKALYPFITPAPGANLSCTGANANAQTEQGTPWDWWNESVFIASYNAYSSTTNGPVVNCLAKLSNPNMSATQGRTYIDTIQGYLNPRLVCAMGLAGCLSTVGLKEYAYSGNLNVFPNPVTSEINYSVSGGNTISRVTLLDATGRLVLSANNLNETSFKLNRNNLSAGLYFTTIELGNKTVVTKKIVIE
ncbi:hypothetical protein CNR22_13240 [Sphingobacteriaceae bacterium]|nr:hypothetical protein CNR22_13240 [Sphingobacteriaceae bacterium]